MGRTLDALKNRDDSRGSLLPDTKEPPQVTPEIVTEWSLGDGDVPYIEVGPDRMIFGSPQVIAAAPPMRVSSLDPVTVPALRISSLDSPAALTIPPPTITNGPTTATRTAPARQESSTRPSATQPPHPQTEQGLVRTSPTPPQPASTPSSSLSAQMLRPKQVSATLEPMDGLYEIGKIAAEVIAYHDPKHPISQQYAQLAAQLLSTEEGKALLLSGIRTGVGTSTVLLNLAVSAAQANKRVTIVDANRTQPSIANKLGLKPKAFLQDVLTGGVALTDAVVRSPIPKLAVLAVSASHPEIALGVEAFIWLLTTLKEKNDLVLVDGPSLDQKTEVSPLVSLVDSLFLVSPKGEPAATSGPLFQLISKLGGRIRGLLHTQQT
jgi:Mrp family chromosome partitioning ATPase